MLMNTSSTTSTGLVAPSLRLAYFAVGSDVYETSLLPELYEAIQSDLYYDTLVKEAFLLKLKANGKELNPLFFDKQEAEDFEKSDEKEWDAWLKNGVIRRLSPEEAKKVPRDRIFKVPARIVRVNKTPAGQFGLQAKSRIVLPGHLDPDLGALRTDAPTTSLTAVRMALAVAASRQWQGWLFDASTAFLSGKNVYRDLYARPPNDLRGVSPGELWLIIRSAYGLEEAPRLWYEKAHEDEGWVQRGSLLPGHVRLRDEVGQEGCSGCHSVPSRR